MEKVWSKPKLIVLTRGRPEESVLDACKDGAPAFQDSGGVETACQAAALPSGYCADCDTYATT